MFPKVKNVNVESPKKTLKIVGFFGALFPLSSPRMLMNDFIKAAFILLGARIVFVGEARIDFVWNSNCSRIVQKLMRQLMGINGETFLARSALGKTRSDSCAKSLSKLSPALCKPHGKASAIPLKSRKTQIFSNFLSQSLARFRKSPYFCTR